MRKLFIKSIFSQNLKREICCFILNKKKHCDICEMFKFGRVSEKEYNNHQLRKVKARLAKDGGWGRSNA